MKTVSAVAAALMLCLSLTAAPVQAQTVNLAKTSCKEFLASGKDGIALIWAWLYGYYSDQDADPVIDFGKLTAKGQALAEACQKSPDKDVISVAEDIYEK
jgi:ABC-type glycerol-3-phosphate transport system substrate-binding protein